MEMEEVGVGGAEDQPQEEASSNPSKIVDENYDLDLAHDPEHGDGMEEGGVAMATPAGGKKRWRPKKRQLYLDICSQMEFYFSDANISRNRMMLDLISKQGSDGFVPLCSFLEFNRMKGLLPPDKDLAGKISHLKKALVNSSILEVSPPPEEGGVGVAEGVRRKVPYDPTKLRTEGELEACTVYVENIPRTFDHALLQKMFISFGPISYISVPKFKTSGMAKGFAFIEFESEEGALNCIRAYQGQGQALPEDTDPSTLQSVTTFIQEKKEEWRKEKRDKEKEKPQEPKEEVKEVTATAKVRGSKRGHDQGDDNPPGGKRSKNDEEEENNNDEALAKSRRKKRKKRKKGALSTQEDKLEGDAILLRVIPKRSWRLLRNRYLNLQRQNMVALKKRRREEAERDSQFAFFSHPHHPQREGGGGTEGEEEGYIVHIQLDSPAESVQSFKSQVELTLAGQTEEEALISGFVKYVDYEEGGLGAWVRFGEDPCFSQRIGTFLSNAEKVFKKATRLTVCESLEYKAKVQAALKEKKKGGVAGALKGKKRERGKDRLLRVAAGSLAQAQHIRFSSDEEEDGDEGSMEDPDPTRDPDPEVNKVKMEEN